MSKQYYVKPKRRTGRGDLVPLKGHTAKKNGQQVTAPAAQSRIVRTSAPRFSPGPNGSITITHEESISDVRMQSGGAKSAVSIPMEPKTFPWLGGVAEHFSQFHFNKLEAEYRPLVATDTPGAVTVAPSYDASDPLADKGGNGIVSTLIWLKSLPGAEQFAVWASGEVKARVSEFLRKKYRTAANSAMGSTQHAEQSTNDAKESQLPCYFVVGTEGGAAIEAVGTLWVRYSITLWSPFLPTSGGIKLYKAVTDSSALYLHGATRVGRADKFKLSMNTITFLRSGSYTFAISYDGSTPVPDYDGYVVKDRWGTVVTDRYGGIFDVSQHAVVAQTASYNNHMSVAGSSENVHHFGLNITAGDSLVIPALSSGSMTAYHVEISENDAIHVVPAI
jgi:hypothetical protein